MAKNKNKSIDTDVRLLEIEDLELIVGGAVAATHQQFDALKQGLLADINSPDIANAVAADAVSIANNPTNAATINTAITSIEALANTDHVSQAATLAALDAATYGGAQINGTDAIAAALTQSLSSGAGEADMAHIAALNGGGVTPQTLVSEIDQSVQVLALGSTNGQTALGLQTNAAVDLVEAKLESAAGSEASADQAQVTADQAQVTKDTCPVIADQISLVPLEVISAFHLGGSTPTLAESESAYQAAVATLNADQATLTSAQSEVQGATALQSYLDVSHQGEVAEGKGIETVFAALGNQLGTIQADAAALQGMTGAAAVAAIAAAEQAAGAPSDVTLVALDLMTQGNAAVQSALSSEYTNGWLESNLARDVVTGALTGDQAVQTLNLAVADLSQNSVNSNTTPALEQGFATAIADVKLANDAGALAATNISELPLALGLQTLINTNYSSEVALANELTAITSEVGANAATYIADAGNILNNPSLAAGYISAIEQAGQAAEASGHGVFSVDAALTLLAAYSDGNQTVLTEINNRLVNGAAEADIAGLVATGALTQTQALTTLTGLVDAVAAHSPNNSVTFTGTDGNSIVLDRNSAVDYAEAQLTKAVIELQSQDQAALQAAGQAVGQNFIHNLFSGNFSQLSSAWQTMASMPAELARIGGLLTTLETTNSNQVLEGLGIDISWTSSSASADSAAAIAAGTSTVQTGYGPENQVSASAQALANSINAQASTTTNADIALAQSIMQLNLNNLAGNTTGGDTAVQAAVTASANSETALFAKGLSDAEFVDPDLADTVNVIQDPTSLSNWKALAVDAGTEIAMSAAGADVFEAAGMADRGILEFLNMSAVSDVLGSNLTGDLKGYYQTAADVCEGVESIFKDNVSNSINLVTSGVQSLVTTLWSGAESMGNDLASGNIGALPGDLQHMVSSFGGDVESYASNWFNTGKQDVEDTFHDVTTMLGNMADSIMSSPDISAAVHWVDNAGKSVLQGLSDIGIGMNQIEGWFSSTAGNALNELESLGDGIKDLSSTVLNGIKSVGGDIKDGLVDFGDDIASIY
jgi:hypothetical protein